MPSDSLLFLHMFHRLCVSAKTSTVRFRGVQAVTVKPQSMQLDLEYQYTQCGRQAW